MTENEGTQEAAQEATGSQAAEETPDYKALYEQTRAEARKWETRSKATVEKARKYDELTGGEKSIEDRIAELEAANKRLSDEKERGALVRKVAKATGVAEEIVATLAGADEKTITAQAKAIAEAYRTPGGAPRASEAGTFPHGEPASDEKRKFVRQLLGRD